VVDNERKSQIVNLVDAHFKGEVVHPDSYSRDVFGFETVDQSLHTRTAIKVQDGCDNFCTYCIVPMVRGKALSRPIGQILENVRRVVDNGFKEIVITGVNIGRYDHGGLTIEGAIERILELPGDFRVRISSLEPDGFGPEFHRLFKHPKMTPHLHLCIQSGSDAILLKMRRMYTVKSFMEIIEKFRGEMADFNFTTDVIVGFPGETGEDFQKTLHLVREAKFSHVHTFRYSRRKGTRADRMEDQLAEHIKNERSEMVRTLALENRNAYMESMVGKKQRVLVERVDHTGVARGYGEHYLPVHFPTKNRTRNRFEEILLTRVLPGETPVITGSMVQVPL
jgi:threonylcarbamoyladenosine tRNA methylthiotransferase MtaB